MKKPQLRFSNGSVRYRLIRKCRNLYKRVRLLLESDNPCEKELKRLTHKLEGVYRRLERAFSKAGVKVAGTALAIALTATISQAQTVTFEKQVVPGSEPLFDKIEVGGEVAPTFVDIDGDGDMDLFVGESGGEYGGISFYENIGTSSEPYFKTRSENENPLDQVNGFYRTNVSFGDIDGDGDLDAIVGEYYGFVHFYENTGSSSDPAFALNDNTDGSNPFNGIDVGEYSHPELADIDGDGDLDLFIGDSNGNIDYYKNTGSNSSATFAEQTGGANPFDGESVDGYATPTFIDIDDDGDLDALVGQYYYNYSGYVNFFENTGTASAPAFAERNGNEDPFRAIEPDSGYTDPTFADLDNDGDLDVLVGNSYGTPEYFENKGTASEPDFGATAFTKLTSGYFYDAAPSFADIDNDGDMDLFVGGEYGYINFYENTGTASAPAFSGGENPLSAVSSDVSYNANVAFADVDADGDLDALVGEKYGSILFYENTGSASAAAFALNTFTDASNPFYGISVDSWSNPELADIDDDGDFDLFIGDYDGYIAFYENTGDATDAAFQNQTGAANPFDSQIVDYSANPSFGDFDDDGDLDMLTGSYSGYISFFENTGSASAPAFVQLVGANNPFDHINHSDYSHVAVADLDNDGDFDLLVGDDYGDYYSDRELHYYENEGTAAEPNFEVEEDELVPNTLNPLDEVAIYFGARATFVDIDNDGDMDAFFGTSYDGLSYYKNTGNNTSAAFSEVTGSADPFDGLIGGEGGPRRVRAEISEATYIGDSAPIFADIDNDGDMDAFIGSKSGPIYYFKNTGSAASPAFAEQTGSDNPFDGLIGGSGIPARVNTGYAPSYYAGDTKPALVDLDGDGDLDAIVGSEDGDIFYLKNTGSASAPAFEEQTDEANPFSNIGESEVPEFARIELKGPESSLRYSHPSFADLDKDGDMDLILGDKYGSIQYYKNTGSSSAPSFEEQTGSANNPFEGETGGEYSAPAFVDIDGDGDMDLFVSYEVGGEGPPMSSFSFFKNTTNAAPTITSNGGDDTAEVSAAENQTSVATVKATDPNGDAISYSISDGADKALFSINSSSGVLTFKTAPDFEAPGDANADNKYELEVTAMDDGDGNLVDTQTITVSVTDVSDDITAINDLNKQISVYPNPASHLINIKGLSSQIQSIRLVDFSGKTLLEKDSITSEVSIDLSAYKAGIYIMKIQTDRGLINQKIQKL
ncbi:FG-GAP-like repeat-containing protein [Reichenbachiella sp.]|uniref:FG-GAP-like repeat-containing protein n=1 Tax=Reichenbachiella sp. TaxID=2184521 RepID=UPI003B591C86